MASTCIGTIDLCAARITRLTDGGAPETGANNGYLAGEATVSLGVSITTEAGDDITQKNGCGDIVNTRQTPDKIKGVELTLTLCQLDAQLIEILTGAQVISSGGNAIGVKAPAFGVSAPPVCFEAWSRAMDGDHQYVAPFTDPEATWIHWVFPLTRWVQGDFTIGNDGFLTYPVTAKGSENPSITQDGPYNDWPSAVAVVGGADRMYNWFLDTEGPADTCDYITVSSAAS